MMLSKLFESDNKLKPEDDDGNIEYKLRLDSKDGTGHKKLVSQMKWRLNQGKEYTDKYEAHYVLGVFDDGTMGCLTEADLKETKLVFDKIVESAGCIIFNERYHTYDTSNIYYAHVKKKPIDKKMKEIYVLFLGQWSSGKTTLISNLSYSTTDNGEGRARNLIFRHEHEKISGHTSYLKKEIIGINDGHVVNYGQGMGMNWEDVAKTSDVIINIFDTPGNIKYIKTTLYGLSATNPDHIFVVIDASYIGKDYELTKFYITYAKILNIPYTVLLSKKDTIEDELIEEIINEVKKIYEITQVVVFSNITDEGIDDIFELLKNVKKRELESKPYNMFTILETFDITDTGVVVTGIMNSGTLEMNDHMRLIGNSKSKDVIVKSIHKKEISSEKIYAGESGALHLSSMTSNNKIPINKNCIIVSEECKIIPCQKFKIIVNELYFPKVSLSHKKYYIFSKNNTFNALIKEIDIDTKTIIIITQKNISIEDNSTCILRNDYNELYLGIISSLV
uniref:Tr-type G domain-containing protein n=1 Tax=viral metagenome TaxID=1070528 RepID=A0A6C0EAC7_9ZZZZ